MQRLAPQIVHFNIERDLQVEHAGGAARSSSQQQRICVDLPDVATGLRMRCGLPYESYHFLSLLSACAFTLELQIRCRTILTVAEGKSGILICVGLQNVQLRPLALAFTIAGW